MTDVLESTTFNDEDTMEGRFLTFLVGDELYGIEIRHVMEIVGIQPITELPEVTDYVKGIINLRGRIIPVIDIRLRFTKAEKEYNDRTCVIITCLGGKFVGLIVDCVSEVLTIQDQDITENPESESCAYVQNIAKSGDQVILLIDCQMLLNENHF